MHEKTGHDNKGMSGHGFTFPVGGSVPVIFISMPRAQFKRLFRENLRICLRICWRMVGKNNLQKLKPIFEGR
jgi:hypothetical protein